MCDEIVKEVVQNELYRLVQTLVRTLVVLLDHQVLFSVYAKECYFFFFIKYKEHIIIYTPLYMLLELL